MKIKLISTGKEQFIESFLKPLKTLTFLYRDFFVFDKKIDLRENRERIWRKEF